MKRTTNGNPELTYLSRDSATTAPAQRPKLDKAEATSSLLMVEVKAGLV